MVYTNSNPVAQKKFYISQFLVLFLLLNVKLFLVTGFEFLYAVTALCFS